MLQSELAPGLLLAMPRLADPNFSRAVVFMIEHSDEGSFGLVINQPTKVSVSSLFEKIDQPWHGPQDSIVWRGGPVSPTEGRLMAPRNAVDEHGGWLEVGPDSVLLSVGHVIAGELEIPSSSRLILGYSGWGPGQLASEVADGAWLHAEASGKVIFETDPEDMWEAAMGTLGINPRNIISGSGIH